MTDLQRIADLQAQNATLQQLLEQHVVQNGTLTAQVQQLLVLVEGLQKQLAAFLPKAAGPKPASAPALPAANPLDAPSLWAPPEPPLRAPSKRRKPRRVSLDDALPRDIETYPVESCPSCGSHDLAALDTEVSERLAYIRAHVRVRRIERPKVRCRGCETLSTAPMPPVAVLQGQLDHTMLAHLAYSKCGLHLPLKRIAEELANQGVTLPSSTMSDAMGHTADLLAPVYDALLNRLFASPLLHADGTGLTVLRPGQKGQYRGQFLAVCNEDATAYVFTPSKHGEHLTTFFRVGSPHGYEGFLVADAASNMNRLYDDGRILECGCWFHARDKFVEARPNAPFAAEEGVAWIGALFDVEQSADEAGETAEERRARRRRESVPILHEFERWMESVMPRFAPDEAIAKAIRYVRTHRDALWRFVDHGPIPLTNNLAERELGVIGRGRKAFLFAGSDAGARRLAVLHTVVRTCQRLGADPFAYLCDVLPRLSVMPANRGLRLADLTPHGWFALQDC